MSDGGTHMRGRWDDHYVRAGGRLTRGGPPRPGPVRSKSAHAHTAKGLPQRCRGGRINPKTIYDLTRPRSRFSCNSEYDRGSMGGVRKASLPSRGAPRSERDLLRSGIGSYVKRTEREASLPSRGAPRSGDLLRSGVGSYVKRTERKASLPSRVPPKRSELLQRRERFSSWR